MKHIISICIFLLVGTKAITQPVNSPFVDGVLYLKLQEGSGVLLPTYPYEGTYPYFENLILQYGIETISFAFPGAESEVLQGIYKIRFDPQENADELISELLQFNFVDYAEKQPVYGYFSEPDDPRLPLQYALKRIMADSLWSTVGTGGSQVNIAVIDDAFNIDHEDLGNVVLSGYDMGDNDSDPRPPSNVLENYFSHGTHVAAIAGAEINNAKGMASLNINDKLRIIPIKLSSDAGLTQQAPLASAMQQALNMGADIVSMSLGSINFSNTDSIFIAANPQVIFVCAAGNCLPSDPNTDLFYPASYNLPNVISVAASNEWDELGAFSIRNTEVDVVAPGSGILSALGTGDTDYGFKRGTSMATPLVSSLCALVWSLNSSMTSQQVINRVLTTADDISFENPGSTNQMGSGRINAWRAVNNIATAPYNAGFRTLGNRSLCTGDVMKFRARNYASVWYIWDFGDGTVDTTTADSIQHTYAMAGHYDVSLRITNLSGTELASHTFTEYIGVTSCQPITGESAQWYFGVYGELDFRSGRPASMNNALNAQTIYAAEGSFSICNAQGNLLFYGGNKNTTSQTNQLEIYDKNHQLKHTSSIFYGTPSQGYLPLFFLNNYYLFVTDIIETNNGLHYFRIDTSATTISVTGPVGVKAVNSIPRIDTAAGIHTDESITAIPNCDNDGYWIIVHGETSDTNYNNRLIVLELYDSAGVYVRYNSSASNGGNGFNLQTNLKVSPDGRFVAIANQNIDLVTSELENTTTVFSFNNQSGTLDSLFTLGIGGSAGISFSPNSRFLYVMDNDGGLLYQVDLYDPNPNATKRAQPSEYAVGDMCIGPDDKIYVSYMLGPSMIGVIDFPDSLNTFHKKNRCGYRQRSLSLYPGTNGNKFPNFITARPANTIQKDFTYARTGCTGITFFPAPTCDTAILWYFGDGDSSIFYRPSYTYGGSGDYTVWMITGQDTIEKIITVGIGATIIGDTGICDTAYEYTYHVRKDDYYEYEWTIANGTILTDPTEHSIRARFASSGTLGLKVVVTDLRTGCSDSSEVHPVFGLPIPGNTIGIDSQPCEVYMNGSTIIPGAGTVLYGWQVSSDTTNWINLDSLEDQNWFVPRDSLYFQRIAVNSQCQSTSEWLKVFPVPQIEAQRAFTLWCDSDTAYAAFNVHPNNWDSSQVWIRVWKKTNSQGNYTLTDSLQWPQDSVIHLMAGGGDSVIFSIVRPCGEVFSQSHFVDSVGSGNVITLDSLPCMSGMPFSVSGSALPGVSYQWMVSTDSLNWFPASAADTLQDYQDSLGSADTVYYRRLAFNGHCTDSGNVVAVYPQVKLLSSFHNVAICPGGVNYNATINLQLLVAGATTVKVRVHHKIYPSSSYAAVDSFLYSTPVDHSISVGDQDSVRFEIIAGCGGSFFTAAVGVFTCNQMPSFSVHPVSTQVNEDASTMLTAQVSDCDSAFGPVTPGFQEWEMSIDNGNTWSSIAGSANDTLFLDSASLCEDQYQYRAKYRSPCAVIIPSNAATITVNRTNFSDVMMRDYFDDIGLEPNTITPWYDLYDTPDFWIRWIQDGGTDDQGGNFPGPNYVYYRVKNKGTDTSRPADLYMHWTLGGPNGQNWPIAWTNNANNTFTNQDPLSIFYGNTYPLGGPINTVAISIPPLAPGQSMQGVYEWFDVPNPLRYYHRVGSSYVYSPERDMCLLARLHTCELDSFGLFRKEIPATRINIINNNNIVGRNSTLHNVDGVMMKKELVLCVRRFAGDIGAVRLTLSEVPAVAFNTVGYVNVILDNTLWAAWVSGGMQGSGFNVLSANTLRVTNLSTFSISNINLQEGAVAFVNFEFNLNGPPAANSTHRFAVGQYNGSSLQPTGGYVYRLNVMAGEGGGGPVIIGKSGVNDRSIADVSQQAEVFAYPNPFDAQVYFSLNLPEKASVGVEIFSATGTKVASITPQEYPAGTHTVAYDGSHLAAGVYFCRVNMGDHMQVIHLTVE